MEAHEELRPYLFAIAYRMFGSAADAEDVVQEAFLRYHGAEAAADSPKAYLATVTTRLAIDQLRSARTRRETYPGEWLPEPLVDDEAARHAEMSDSLSLAFLHLLEKLSPVERAVFLLREVFDYPYEDVARIVGKTPDNCRQLLTGAHRHIDEGRRRFDVSREERDEVARRFLPAWEEGDTDALIEVLAPDATVYGDGGRKTTSIPRAARRRRACREGAHRLGPSGARPRGHAPPRARQRRPRRRLLRAGRERALGRSSRDIGRRRRRGEVDPQPRQARARGPALSAPHWSTYRRFHARSGEPLRRSTPKSAVLRTSSQLTQPAWNSTQASGSSQWHVTWTGSRRPLAA